MFNFNKPGLLKYFILLMSGSKAVSKKPAKRGSKAASKRRSKIIARKISKKVAEPNVLLQRINCQRQ